MSAASSATRCHYEVLGGLPRTADEDEIRKAYRRLAVKLHPDKALQRGEDVEAATLQFRELQAAYECLSDADERAFYDANREEILRGDDPHSSEAEDHFEARSDAFEARLWPYFSRSAFGEFDDHRPIETVATWFEWWNDFEMRLSSASYVAGFLARMVSKLVFGNAERRRTRIVGFYPCYYDAFAEVDRCEAMAADANGSSYATAPSFGSSRSDWVEVAAFYSHFENFRSVRTFQEASAHLGTGQNRSERRQLENLASAARREARRDYEDAVRKLAAFCKRRDPRVRRKRQNDILEKERREREEKIAKEEQRRAFQQARKDWLAAQRRREGGDDEEASEEDDVVVFFCDVCAKQFKTRHAFQCHSLTKQHERRAAAAAEQQQNTSSSDGDQGDQERREQRTGSSSVDEDGALQGQSSEGKEESCSCAVCDRTFCNPAALESHFASRAHRARVKQQKKKGRKPSSSR